MNDSISKAPFWKAHCLGISALIAALLGIGASAYLDLTEIAKKKTLLENSLSTAEPISLEFKKFKFDFKIGKSKDLTEQERELVNQKVKKLGREILILRLSSLVLGLLAVLLAVIEWLKTKELVLALAAVFAGAIAIIWPYLGAIVSFISLVLLLIIFGFIGVSFGFG